MKRTLVLLTFNEIEGLRALWDRIPFDAADEVFAVDPGSTDGTLELFREKGLRVLIQEKRGRGEAFRIASREAAGEVLCFFSPDGNEDPADIPRLFSKIEEGFDLAIASRFLPGSRNDEAEALVPLRALANRGFTILAGLFFGGRVSDTINGFRAIRRDRFVELDPDADGFAIEFQVSIGAMKKNLRIAEIPTIEGDRIGGQSTAYSIPTGLKVLRVLVREIWIGKRFGAPGDHPA
jgi:glycosyltransferase involved in cell wall biosynthesis